MNGIGGIPSLPPVTCVVENDIVKEMVPKIVEDVDTDNVTKINGIKSMQNSKTLNLQRNSSSGQNRRLNHKVINRIQSKY